MGGDAADDHRATPVPGADRRIPPEAVLRLLARVMRVVSALFVKLEIHGGRCASEISHGLIAANHRSMADAAAGMVILHRFGHYPRILIAREYVETGWFGVLSRAVGAVPVDRSGDPSHSLDVAIATLDAGVSILVMPEGRFHRDPDDRNSLGPAKTGIARLALASGEPVVVAALAGTEDAWPPGRRLPHLNPFRRRRIVCVVADDPLHVEGDDPRVATDRVMEELQRHLVVANRHLSDGRRDGRRRRRRR